MFRLTYDREILEALHRDLPPATRDEMAIPSYLHPNPLARWVVTQRMRVILDLMRVDSDEALLDFGCGTGMLLLQLGPRRGASYGVDLELGPARRMLEGHGRRDCVLLSASDWAERIEDASLDCIVALEVLEHVDDVAALAELFRRKLTRSGRLVVCGPTESALYRLGRAIVGFSGEYHRRDIYDIMPEVEAAGFVAEARRAIPLPGPATLFRAARYRVAT